MTGSRLNVGRWRDWCSLLICLIFAAFEMPGRAQISLNVTNFGAVGDAVQFYANTVRNSVIITTTNIFANTDIGKAVEVFGCGSNTFGLNSYSITTGGNQDLVGTITNVVNGTNLYIDKVPFVTMTNTFTTVGHDNSINIENAIAAAVAAGTNVTVSVPAGKYLCLSRRLAPIYADASIQIFGGGFHLIGAGMTNTVLLGQGAWRLDNVGGLGCYRGILLAVPNQITNDYPVSIENLTLDGGVEHGNTPIHGTYANQVDGLGWDVSHDAIDYRRIINPGTAFSDFAVSNVLTTHWRGEMFKSNDYSTNGNLRIVNSFFRDGNATAINIYSAVVITNCVFDNLFQIAEYYQAYSQNTSYFVNNLTTNITANGFAINGGKGDNPPFVIQGNIFYYEGAGNNGIMTTPADNVIIRSNLFVAQGPAAGHFNGIVVGSAGYQGTFCNSNIVISGNVFSNVRQVIQFGGSSSTDPNRTVRMDFNNNTIIGTNLILGTGGGWAEDVRIFSNSIVSPVDPLLGSNIATVTSGGRGGPITLVDIENLYWSPIYDLKGKTNLISYANGSRFRAVYKFYSGAVYALTETNASQMPARAQIMIQNSTVDQGFGNTIPVYLNSSLTGNPVMIPGAQTTTFNWNGSAWTTNYDTKRPAPPTNLRGSNF